MNSPANPPSGPPTVVDLTEDLLGLPAQTPPAAPPSPSVPTNAIAQAVPGVTPPAHKGPMVATMPTVVPRGTLIKSSSTQVVGAGLTVDLSADASFEVNMAKLLGKDLELAQHDRSLAISLLQVHLDRAEVLDAMPLSMPVATVIADNTGATLKALELAMRSGERVHKTAELLVMAQKNGDSVALAALKIKLAEKGDNGGWGDEDVPGGNK